MDQPMLAPGRARALFRAGRIARTAGWCEGYVQAGLVAVPSAMAYDLVVFAERNADACPVLDVTEPGSPRTTLAPSADLRTDLPRYRVAARGELVDECADVRDIWDTDLVALLANARTGLDDALAEAGIPLRHRDRGLAAPSYVTNRRCRRAGAISGPLLATMRAVPLDLLDLAVRAAERVGGPGIPVHTGNPQALGIEPGALPYAGDRVPLEPGDVPVFWPCPLSLQTAVMTSHLPFAIMHAPGYFLITDRPDGVRLRGVA